MGARKKISAEKRKEALKTMYFAKLQNVPAYFFLLPAWPRNVRVDRKSVV